MKSKLTAFLIGSFCQTLTLIGLAQEDPEISLQPTNVTVSIYDTAQFSVVASGSPPLTYQWLFNTNPIDGETNAVLILPTALPSKVGDYSVIVSNAFGAAVTSSNAHLTVLTQPPVITRHPTNVTVYAAQTAIFSVQATGTPILSYQWRSNGVPLPGRTGTSLVLNNVQFSYAANYSVVVSNAFGTATSSNAQLTVKQFPNCVPAPSGLVSWWRGENNSLDGWSSNNGSPYTRYETGKVGRAFSFGSSYVFVPESPSLVVSNNAFSIEAWVKPTTSSSGGGLGTILSRFDYDRPSFGSSYPTGNSSYYLGLSNGIVVFKVSAGGSPTNNVTTLTTPQSLTNNQWTHLVATFGQGTMRVFINGSQSIKKPHSGGVFPGNIGLGIGAMVATPDFALGYANPFSGMIDEVSVYNRELTEFEVQALFNSDLTGKCLTPPTIVGQPRDQAIPLGEDVKFTVDVIGTRPLQCQWYFNGARILGATDTTLVLEKVRTNQAGLYHVAVTNSMGWAISARASLSLLPAPSCVTAPAGLISWWPADGNARDAMGTNNGTDAFGGTYVTGKVSRAFNFNLFSSRVTVNSSPSLNFGSNANFSIETWIKAWPTNSSFDIPFISKGTLALTPVAATSGYGLSLNQGRLAFWINPAQLAFPSPFPQLSPTETSPFISPGPDLRDGMFHHVAVSLNRTSTNGGKLFVDGQLVLTFNASTRNGSLASSSPLYVGGVGVRDALTTSFGGMIDEPAIYNRALASEEILAIAQAGAAGKCKVPPSILVQPVSQRVTQGSNVTFSVLAAGTPALRYQWLRSGQPISTATNPVYTFVAIDSASFSVRVTNLFGTVTSSNATLKINNRPVINTPTSLTLNEDTPTPITLRAVDSDLDPLDYIIVLPPTNGILSGSSSNRIYTPATNFFGSDKFSFKVNDGLADSLVTTVFITVLPVNDAPVAHSQSISVAEDHPISIHLSADDVEHQPITYTVGLPAHGLLSGIAPDLVYQPGTNYFGPDSFTFTVSDGPSNSLPATVSITVLPVNDPPVASIVVAPLAELPGKTNLLVIAPACKAATVVLDGSRSSDVENDPLQYYWSEGTNLFAQGVLATNKFAPGIHEITLAVSDGSTVSSNSIEIEVVAPEDAIELVLAFLNDSDLNPKRIQPVLASLRAAAGSFERCNALAGTLQLKVSLLHIDDKLVPLDPVLAETARAAVQEILDAAGIDHPPRDGNHVSQVSLPAHGKFKMTFSGNRSRVHYIEVSTDLQHWSVVGVARDCGNGTFDFEDAQSPVLPMRFYRIQK